MSSEDVPDRKIGGFRDLYILETESKKGEPWVLCMCKSTWEYYACKSIQSCSIPKAAGTKIMIMDKLAGNENISIKGVYDDTNYVHIVMETCIGKRLSERIEEKKYSRRQAAKLTKIIVGVIKICHSLGVVLGDLNKTFIFVNNDDDSPLRAVDFGSAKIPAKEFEKQKAQRDDIRSAGWILYALLTHEKMPEEKKKGTLHAKLKSGKGDEWKKIPEGAKSLILNMLGAEPLTAEDVLDDKWISTNGFLPETKPDEVDVDRLKTFRRKKLLEATLSGQ